MNSNSSYVLPRAFFMRPKELLATQVWAQGSGNFHAATWLLVYFKQGQHNAWRGDGGVVEGMHKFDFAFLVTIAQVGTARLPVVQVRARMRLAVAIFARQPAFQVVHAHFAVAHVTCADADHAVGQFQGLCQLLRVCQQRLVPAYRLFMVSFADDVLLNFVELMDAEDAARIFAIGTSLAAEAGAEGDEAHRQVSDFEDFIFVHTCDRDFARADQEGVVVLDGVDLVTPLWELSAADKAEFTGHGWHNQWRKAFLVHAIHGEIHQRQFQARRVVLEDVAASARDLDAALNVHHVKLLHERVVVAGRKIKGGDGTPVFDGHIVVLVLADGSARIGYVGHEVEQLLAFFQQRVQFRFQAFNLLGKLLAFRNDGLTLSPVAASLLHAPRKRVLLSTSFFHQPL